jgi:hypothetical protein
MATTTNFGWETPDDTDLVKDGAAAIRTALGGVDTSFVDLKGGTTGQVLAKATNTDLDFIWADKGSTWTTWTPTLTNITLGNGTVTARYQQLGKTVSIYFKFLLGSTSAVSGNPTITLPVNSVYENIAPAYIQDAGTNNYYGIFTVNGGTGTFVMQNVAGTYPSFAGISSTVPMTWTTNDYLYSNISYEVA